MYTVLKPALFFSAPLGKGVIHAGGVAGILTIYYVWIVGVLFPVVSVPCFCFLLSLFHVVSVVYVPVWSVGVLLGPCWGPAGVFTPVTPVTPVTPDTLVMRCVRTGGLVVAPALLWRELSIDHNFIVLSDLNH